MCHGLKARLQVFQINKVTGSEEGGPYVTNRALHAAFLIPPGYGHGARFVAIVSGELQQRWMKADGVAVTFQHRALKIIVQQDSRDAAPCREGTDVAAQKVFHPGIQEEAQINRARIAQHHDEGQ
jgi:hypothetical protein